MTTYSPRRERFPSTPRRLASACLIASLMLATTAQATQAEHIRASHAWLRLLPADLPAGAYVTLENTGDQPAALTSASTASYAHAMLHQSASEGGTSRMSMVDTLPIPAHGTVSLAPAGYHLMLMKTIHPLKPGDTVSVTLTFSDGSKLTTPFIARPANALDAEH